MQANIMASTRLPSTAARLAKKEVNSCFRALSTSSNFRAGNENRLKSLDEIPGPLSLPLIGSFWTLPLMMSTKKRFETAVLYGQADSVKEFGRIAKMTVPGVGTMVAVSDPKAMHKIYQNEAKYPLRFLVPLFDTIRQRKNRKPGVFFGTGPHWYKHRNVISKRMLRPKEVAEYIPVFNEIASDFLDRLSLLRGPEGSEHENEVQHLDNELFKWSFESVAHLLFEKRFGCLEEQMNPEAQDFILSVQGFLSSMLSVMMFPPWLFKYYETKGFRKFVKHYDNMYHWVDVFIQRKLKEQGIKEREDAEDKGRKADFFEFLLSNKKITEEEIQDSIVDLLFAGVDTTSNTMQWVLYMMGKHPEKQEQLHHEVTSVLPPGEQPCADTLARMPYLKAWVRETLRLYPVLSTQSRILHEDIEVMGYLLPAGTQVMFQTFFMSRDEQSFKDPETFLPERWLRDEQHKISHEIEAFASVPFGFGTRMCLGRRVAEMELHLLLAQLVQRFVVEYPHSEEIEPFMRTVTVPDRPLRVRFSKRKAA